MRRRIVETESKSRETTYTGPCFVVREDELVELENVLTANPRPWNKGLRVRIAAAKEREGQ
jgi:hypothetical protein